MFSVIKELSEDFNVMIRSLLHNTKSTVLFICLGIEKCNRITCKNHGSVISNKFTTFQFIFGELKIRVQVFKRVRQTIYFQVECSTVFI